MRREVTSHIRQAASAINSNGCANYESVVNGDIGCLATKVAAVARMCKIPDNEVLHEAEGQATGTYRRRSSCLPDIEVCTAFGPSYMKQKQHRHWYHVGQNHHHTAALLQSRTAAQQQQYALAQHQLQQQLLLKAQQGTLTPSRAADELLQSFGSNTSSDKASSRSSNSGGLPALPPLQPMTSSASSNDAAAPLSGSSSSSEEDMPGFQADFDSDSMTCTPTYAGDEACLGMLLGTTFR